MDTTSGSGTISVTGGFTNGADGTVTMSGTRDKLTTDTFTNHGSVNIGTGETLTASAGYTQAGGTTNVTGALGTSTTTTAVSVTGGTLEGSGTITGNVTQTGGTVEGGDAPGTLHITGNYTASAGAFDEVIGPDGMGGNVASAIAVTGTVNLAGASLELSELPGVNLTVDEPFDILNYSSLSGIFAGYANMSTFDADNWVWEINYDYDGMDQVDLIAENAESTTSTPEPSGLLSLAFGFVALGLLVYARRRKLQAVALAARERA